MLKQTSKTGSSANLYRNRAVNDLAWALLSPPLFRHLPNTDSAWFKADYIDDDIDSWLASIDREPNNLYDHLSQQRSTRLGIYFEQLLSFYFEWHPRFTLLAKNLQINDQKKTLGELDFVVLDKEDRQYKHIEAAVKFYVGHTHNGELAYRGHIKGNLPLYNWHHWVGPNQKDSLGIKMRHLLTHQIPIINTNAGQAALVAKGINTESIHSRLHLRGRFYLPETLLQSVRHNVDYNHHLAYLMPHNCFEKCLLSSWYKSGELNQNLSPFTNNATYYFLPKQYWLSDIILSKDFILNSTAYTSTQMLEKINIESETEAREWQVVEFTNRQQNALENRRFFILNQQHLPSDE